MASLAASIAGAERLTCKLSDMEARSLRRSASRSSGSPSRSRRPSPRRTTPWLRQMAQGSLRQEELASIAGEMLFSSLPEGNVAELSVAPVVHEKSSARFVEKVESRAGWPRVRVAWHLAGSPEIASSIASSGIRCDEAHCRVGRYGRGGYVATDAAKANAYVNPSSEGCLRHLFLVLALPEDVVVQGRRGLRPQRTAADLPSHPTEYCFVDPARLHCVCLLTYRWVPTRNRQAQTTM